MEEVPGSLGTSASFVLRLGQTVFSSASLILMCSDPDFYSYTAFWFDVLFLDFRSKQGTPSPCAYNPSVRLRSRFLPRGISCGLVAVLGFLSPWSVALALVDAYSIFIKQLPRHSSVTIVIIAGDLVLSFLALGAACSTASVADVLIVAGAPYCRYDLCRKYQYSAVMGFLCWTLLFASSLFNLWLLPYL